MWKMLSYPLTPKSRLKPRAVGVSRKWDGVSNVSKAVFYGLIFSSTGL